MAIALTIRAGEPPGPEAEEPLGWLRDHPLANLIESGQICAW